MRIRGTVKCRTRVESLVFHNSFICLSAVGGDIVRVGCEFIELITAGEDTDASISKPEVKEEKTKPHDMYQA